MPQHTLGAEVLIVISQTTFYVLLFLIMKHGLVDRAGLMDSAVRKGEGVAQLAALYFAMLAVLGIAMLPLESYEFAHFVAPATLAICLGTVAFDVTAARRRGGGGAAPRGTSARAGPII